MPTSVTLLPVPTLPEHRGSAIPHADARRDKVWQSWEMFVPLTLTLTQVSVTDPRVQPVVRPILCTDLAPRSRCASPVMLKLP